MASLLHSRAYHDIVNDMAADEDQTSALYVRLPRREADMLDRAALEGRTSKRALVTSLVQRYLDEQPPGSRPLAVDGRTMGVGRHDFRPAAEPDVLTLETAAALLQVSETDIVEAASAGELPGRRIGGSWRFSRAALIDWLAGG